MIEWNFLLTGGFLFVAYFIYSWVRTASTNKKAGSYTMAETKAGKIKTLLSRTPQPEAEPIKTVAISTVLGTQAETRRTSAEELRASADRLNQEATTRTEQASKTEAQAAALEQARTILEQAGL